MAEPWYYQSRGATFGPFTSDEMKQHVADKKIASDTQVKRGKIAKWVPAYRVKGLLDSNPLDARQVTEKKEEVKAKMDAVDKAEVTSALAESYDQIQGVYRRKKHLVFYPNAVFPKSCIWTCEPVTRLRSVKVQQVEEMIGGIAKVTTRDVRLPIGDSYINRFRDTRTKWAELSPRLAEPVKVLGMLGFLGASVTLIICAAVSPGNMQLMAYSALGLFISAFIYLAGMLVARFDGITETANPFLIPATFRNDGSILIRRVHKDFLVQLPILPRNR